MSVAIKSNLEKVNSNLFLQAVKDTDATLHISEVSTDFDKVLFVSCYDEAETVQGIEKYTAHYDCFLFKSADDK